MDAISVLVAAAAAFGNAALGEVAKRSITDAWDGVKAALHKRHDSSSEVSGLLDELKATPSGHGTPQILDRLKEANLTSQPEVVQALNRLSEVLRRLGVGTASAVQVGELYGAVTNQGVINQTFNNK